MAGKFCWKPDLRTAKSMNSPAAVRAPLVLSMAYGRYFDELDVGGFHSGVMVTVEHGDLRTLCGEGFRGSGADAANHPITRSKRDSACPPLATTEAEGRAAGAWRSSRFYF